MSLQIIEQQELQSYNTFGLAARAEFFVSVSDVRFLEEALNFRKPTLILGGGSNVLITSDIEGFVLHINLKGRHIIDQNNQYALVEFGAGESWHECVLQSLDWGLGGLENLSLIPGTVGAAPIQNIGAYGVELKDVFESLQAFDIETKTWKQFNHSDCQFGYRDSIFKHAAKGRYIIGSVRLKLTKEPIYHTEYGAIRETLEKMGIDTLSHRAISDAVIQVRQSKLPDPAQIGNSGSFFKNPIIEMAQFESLKARFPQMPHFQMPENQIKVPAGWLIEQCGWKGKRVGNTGAYARQALVLVNYGGATGQEVWKLAQDIQASVLEKFKILIHPEVNVI